MKLFFVLSSLFLSSLFLSSLASHAAETKEIAPKAKVKPDKVFWIQYSFKAQLSF